MQSDPINQVLRMESDRGGGGPMSSTNGGGSIKSPGLKNAIQKSPSDAPRVPSVTNPQLEVIGEDEYECLPASAGFRTFMTAGAIAGVVEHTAFFPLDSIKTRMQSILPHENCRYANVTDAFKHIAKTEGFSRMLRGIHVVALGAGPAHALYFTSYEELKKNFSHRLGVKNGQSSLANACAGAVATVGHDIFMNPLEVVKHRLQMACSPYNGLVDAARTIYIKEGFAAFYRSFFTSLCMNAPFQMVHLVCYEHFQETLNPDREYNPWTHCTSGAFAGAIAAAVTTPLDNIKTVLNTQEACVQCNQFMGSKTLLGFKEAFMKILATKGKLGFFSGIQARVLFQMPATAISWSVYELFKSYLAKKDSHKPSSSIT